MIKATNSGNTTPSSKLTINVEYNGVIKTYEVTYAAYVSAILKKAFIDFNIPEADERKYELRINNSPLFRSARLFDISEIKDNCTLVFHEK